MPSGITHMMISRRVLDKVANEKNSEIHALLQDLRGPYILGCVAPDLPYMTLMDLKLFTDRKLIADHLHYKKTNQVPLLGLRKARELHEAGKHEDADALYAFYLGYTSHLIADGIIHPYVRDMVGDYDVASTDHRILEMKLDVFIAEHLLNKDANNINFHEELDWLKDSKETEVIFGSFAESIKEVHGHDITAEEIKTWIKTMDLVFDTVTGRFPLFYQKMVGDLGAALKDFEILRAEKDAILELRMPIDAVKHSLLTNYMQKEHVIFFEDVLPKYFEFFPKVIVKSYEYVYENGPEPSNLIPEIDLDTGRLIGHTELSNKPAILEIIA